jgi:hypothetical protein
MNGSHPHRSNEGELAIVIDAVPAEFAKGAQDGCDRLAFFLAITMLDGG